MKALIGAAALSAIATAAQASAMFCDDYDAIVERLQADYGETMVGFGQHTQTTTQTGTFVNRQRGTWTVVTFYPGTGIGCVVAAGGGYVSLEGHQGDAPTKEESNLPLGIQPEDGEAL